MVVPTRCGAWAVLAAAGVGCGRPPAPPAGTGAQELVQDYYDGLVRQDWPQAYAALIPTAGSASPRSS